LNKHALSLISTVILSLTNATATVLASELTVTSAPKTVFSAKANKCNPNFIPDSPARAFRRADGKLELIASHFDNWAMIGNDFDTLKVSCHSIFPADRYSHNVDGHLWIQATYTENGTRVLGFASQDLTTTNVACGCAPKVAPGHCWVNQIMSIRSENMGDDFGPGAVIASFGDKYPADKVNQFGFFATTNILRHGDYYYMMIFLTPPDNKMPSGDCVFRTKTPEQPMTWRGWDGADFTYRANQPHSTVDKYALVTPPEFGIPRSIQYIPKNNEFIATSQGRIKLAGEPKPVPGFYSMTSPDLIHWSNLTRVMKMPINARVDDFNDIYTYPSLLDPKSKSKNFETLDHEDALLFFFTPPSQSRLRHYES